MPRTSTQAWLVLLAGLLPILAAHAAYLVNLADGGSLAAEFICMPYVDGCVSISRAARSGPGLWLFRGLMLPAALLLFLTWQSLRSWLMTVDSVPPRRITTMATLGIVGAVFLVFYVTALGQEDAWYRWQRRYGVILYFGGTALAQLLLVWILHPRRHEVANGTLARPADLLAGLVALQWALGVFSSVKRLLFADPVFVDRLENVIEWWYALAMSLAFLAIAWLLARLDRWRGAGARAGPLD